MHQVINTHKAFVDIYRIKWFDLLVKCGMLQFVRSNGVTYLVLLLQEFVIVLCLVSSLSIKWLIMDFVVILYQFSHAIVLFSCYTMINVI